MVVQATVSAITTFCIVVVKGHRNGGPSNCSSASSRSMRVVKGHRNGGPSNFSRIVIVCHLCCERPPKWWSKQRGWCPSHRARVVKGHRNGGSSNRRVELGNRRTGCERPPKWWFKQRRHAMTIFSSGCERPPKWWFKQPLVLGYFCAIVVKGHRNGGSSNLTREVRQCLLL